MKRILLGLICSFVCISTIQAQLLYGTTSLGGTADGGTINKYTLATGDFNVVKSFETVSGFPEYTKFIQTPDGMLYGTTLVTIFSFNPATSTYTRLHEFDSTTGYSNYGRLLKAGDGKLYGMTSRGGSSDSGVIYSYDLLTSTYTKLKDFAGADGATPQGSLFQASDGKLYGMTNTGGTNSLGVIFSFDPASTTYTKLMDFTGANGANPYGNFMQATNGKLYAMTNKGGTNDVGVLFSFDPETITYSKLNDFELNTNGGNPYGSLLEASNGKLYGMADQGGANNYGVIFSFDISSSTYLVLKNLDNFIGANPTGDLIQGSNGTLYGMTAYGRNSNPDLDYGPLGVIFSFDPSTNTYTKLTDFDAAGGYHPLGSLLQATDGKLYGMTNQGAANGYGAIFSFDLSGPGTYTKLKDVSANDEGSAVTANMLHASDGKLYGVTNLGGSAGVGVIFSFDPSTLTYTKLKDFDNTNGATPYSGLIQATNGKLYGMTISGGSNNLGVIYSFDPTTSTYTKLVDFDNTNGAGPGYNLTQGNDGKLYGMTGSGGSSGLGVIFSLDPTTLTYTKLKDFNGTGGAGPLSGLTLASDNKLYGLTAMGGLNGHGTIFSFDPLTSTYSSLKDFDNIGPQGTLLSANDGKLYGMTTFGGGSCNCGTLFSFDPASSAYTELKQFDIVNGEFPYGSLLQASDNKLYGTAPSGGSNQKGVAFSFDPADMTFTKLIDFNGANGASPGVNTSFIEVPDSGPLPVTLISFTGKNTGNNNQLSWKVGNELNLDHYELQRSTDGQNFKAISQIKATGNNSYSYNDLITPSVSIYYYQLKSIDKDGRFTYSVVIKISTTHHGFVSVNPNPFKNKLVVNIESTVADKAAFIITDLNGRQLYKENKLLLPGSNVAELNETTTLAKGTYMLTIITSQQTQSIKIIKGN